MWLFNVSEPAKISFSKIRLFNLLRLQRCCWNQRVKTEFLNWRMNWNILIPLIHVWVCAGEPVRGGSSAEAERGTVRSDPWPQPTCWSHLGLTARPQETASSPGESGQRESGGNHQAHCQNTAAATGGLQCVLTCSNTSTQCSLSDFLISLDLW